MARIVIDIKYGRWLRRIGAVRAYILGIWVGIWLGIAIERLVH